MVVKLNQETNFASKSFLFFKIIFVSVYLFESLLYTQAYAQAVVPPPSTVDALIPVTEQPAPILTEPEADIESMENNKEPIQILTGAQPNKRRIRRHLSLIKGIKVDEEISIPNVPLKILPLEQNLITLARIKGTDIFRIQPIAANSGIVTIHNRKTGQIYAELHLDVREPALDKAIRDLKALLIDIEGLEFKAVNGTVIIDGFVMLPQDLNRLGSVIATYSGAADSGGVKVKSLVTLSPLARKRIVDYISREINNPEVTITVVGDYIKLEGTVNSQEEKNRIQDLVAIYLPTSVNPNTMGSLTNVTISERKITGGAADFILNLITVRKAEEKEEPPEKMIQIVVHFVEFSERFLKSFSFNFSPVASATSAVQLGAVQQAGQNSIESIANIVQNLIPKINWGKTHGFLRVINLLVASHEI
jgi:pilus assembly protein CpaC